MKSSELASSTTFAAHRWVHPELLKMVSLCTKRKGTAMVTAPTTIRGQTTGPVAADGRELTWSLAGPAACWPDWSPQHACTALCRGARLQRPVGQAPAQHLAVFSHARTHARTGGGAARRLLAPTLRNSQGSWYASPVFDAHWRPGRQARRVGASGQQSGGDRECAGVGQGTTGKKLIMTATPVAACLAGLASCTAPCPGALPSRRHRLASQFRIRNKRLVKSKPGR
jgi:hypothetical protein